MKRLYYLLFSFFVVCACQSPRSSGELLDEGQQEETVSNLKEEANIKEVQPELKQMASAAEMSLDSREISNPKFSGAKVNSLQLWSDGESWPVILEVIYPDKSANTKAVYYFRDRKLMAVEKTNANFIFKKEKLQVWADENWQPLKNKTTAQWLDQENYLLNNAKKYLNAFEINYEE